jgi:hypothetical protein
MPFAKLGRFSGMKKGGVMKKRRFDEGGDVEEYSAHEIDPESRSAHGLYDTPKAGAKTSKPAAKSTSDGSYDRKEMRERPKSEDTSGTMARTPKSMGFRREAPSNEQKERNARALAQEAIISAAGPVARGVHRVGQAAKAAREAATRYAETPAIRAMSEANKAQFARAKDKAVFDEMAKGEGYPGFKKGGLMRSKKDIGRDQMGMAPYRKGGEMESKSMMKKEISFMKKKGAPKSMIRHEEAEAKGYKKGGRIKEVIGPRNMSQDVEGGYKAKHLKHGEHSEQKRGHTRGTIVKMAKGGSVRAHGEHSIQLKGHTRGKIC